MAFCGKLAGGAQPLVRVEVGAALSCGVEDGCDPQRGVIWPMAGVTVSFSVEANSLNLAMPRYNRGATAS